MIRLILCDMDGTLLNDKKELPAQMEEVLERCRQKHIIFGIASGRQMRTIQLPFGKYAEEMAFVAENGGYAALCGKTVLFSQIPSDKVQNIIARCKQMKDVFPIVCTADCAYIDSDDPRLLKECGEYYKATARIEDLLQVKEPVCKIAVCDFTGAEIQSYPLLKDVDPELQVSLSGDIWTDVTNRGLSKGNAVLALQKQLGISREETLSFGDYLNDVDLLRHSVGYAMKNAHPDLKPYARYVTEYTNNENGVIRTLENYL